MSQELLEGIREELRAVRALLEGSSAVPEVLTLKEAARRLSCSERTVRRLAQAGQLVLVRIGETPKVPMSEVRRLVTPASSPAMPEQQRTRTPPRAPVKRTSAAMPETRRARGAAPAFAREKARLEALQSKRR